MPVKYSPYADTVRPVVQDAVRGADVDTERRAAWVQGPTTAGQLPQPLAFPNLRQLRPYNEDT